MASERIEVVIDDRGEVVVSVSGVKGQGCHALTKAIESALGTVSTTKETPEANQRAENVVKNRQ